ncbi:MULTISPECIES: sodium:solute symporter family protein [Candidatus Cardinium]|uniref:sodium:solute symporter family protein n=1 Tax=Candidatus Cardinium TaxID=273135 RepID=UPI001FAB1AD9|nr:MULTISPECIES: hypothetical protein [Cardinium]
MPFDFSLLIIILFLLFTLLVAFFSTKSPKTFREHAVGKKQFSLTTLTITLLASIYGGGTLKGGITIWFSDGFFWIVWQFFLSSISLLITGWLAGRMHKFMYHCSMPESIGRVYGKYPRLIATLISVCYIIAFTGLQINCLSKAISMCIDSNNYLLTILATMMICIYAILGGIYAITFTDIWQYITFFSIIVALVWVMSRKIDNLGLEIIPFLETHKQAACSLHNIFFPFNNKLQPILYYLAVLAYMDPCDIQIVYMASSPMQARKVFLWASLFAMVITVCLLLIGLFIFIKVPTLPTREVFDYMVANVPSYFKGLICICLLAMIMSTVDSKLHTGAIIMSREILEHMNHIKISNNQHILLNYLTMATLAILAMLCALYKNPFDYFRLVPIVAIYASIVVAPFILAVLGLRSNGQTALMGMATGLFTLFAWDKWMSPIVGPTTGTFVSIVANGLAILAAHYLYYCNKRGKKARYLH